MSEPRPTRQLTTEPVPDRAAPRRRPFPAARGLAAGLVVAATATGALLAPASPAQAAPKAPVVSTVDVGSNPFDIAVSQHLGKAFVVTDGGVSVVSLLTHRQITEFDTGGYHGQNGIALVRGDTQGYLTNSESNSVVAFDTETHRVIRRIAVGGPSTDIVKANTPKGQRAYVLLTRQQQLVAIDTKKAKVVQRISFPDMVEGLATRTNGKTVWVGSAEKSRAWIVDTSKGKIVKTIKVPRSGPVNGIAIAPKSKRAWVTGPGGVSVISTQSGKVVKYIPAPKMFPGTSNPQEIAFSGSGRYAFVANATMPDAPRRGQLAAVNTTTYKLTWRATTGNGAYGLGVDNRRHVAYVSNFNDDTVSYLSVPK